MSPGEIVLLRLPQADMAPGIWGFRGSVVSSANRANGREGARRRFQG